MPFNTSMWFIHLCHCFLNSCFFFYCGVFGQQVKVLYQEDASDCLEKGGRRYMMWVYEGNRSHYAATRACQHVFIYQSHDCLSQKHHPYKLQPAHTIADERVHMPIFPINLGTGLCCEKRVGYYISPSKTPPGDSLGCKHGQYNRSIFGFYSELRLIAQMWIIPDTDWRSFLLENTHRWVCFIILEGCSLFFY